MAKKKMKADENTSLLSCYFALEIDGIEHARFNKCEGLEAETYIYELEEGGLNTNTRKFYGRTRYPNIVLESGVSASDDLYKWYKDTVLSGGKVKRKSGSVIIYQADGTEVKRWDFVGAIPCRWTGPQLAIDANALAIEKIEIAHEGLLLHE